MSKPMSCILLTSDHEHLSGAAEVRPAAVRRAARVAIFARCKIELAPEVEQIRAALRSERIDCLFDFLSLVIVPPELLLRHSKIFDQFSSCAPEMAGRGSASLALYEGDAKVFGREPVHAMTAKVDSGAILLRDPVSDLG